MQVAASGGRPEPATTLSTDAAETHHLYPSFLPDGRHFVFYIAGKQRGLYVGEIGSNDAIVSVRSRSVAAGRARRRHQDVYAPSGHLLYVRDRVLMARPFDAAVAIACKAKPSKSPTPWTTNRRARRRLRSRDRCSSIGRGSILRSAR